MSDPFIRRHRFLSILVWSYSLENKIFVVGTKYDDPYTIWDTDIKARNLEFISGINPDYFNYLLHVHVNAEDEKMASVALKTTLHHAQETFFSLIGALLQAPECAYAWISKCDNKKLRDIVSAINNKDDSIFHTLNIDGISWNNIADIIFKNYQAGTPRNSEIQKEFAVFWARIAHDFVDQDLIDEYNAIKHGFRVTPGGFTLNVGLEHEYGVPPPENEMTTVGHSDFGVTYFTIKKSTPAKNNRSLISSRTSHNWSFERIALTLQIVAMSINNVISSLKIINGTPPQECKFSCPIEVQEFKKPWDFSTSVTKMNFQIQAAPNEIPETTKDQLITIINKLTGRCT